MPPVLHRQDLEEKAAHSTVAAELQVRREVGEQGGGAGWEEGGERVGRVKREMMTMMMPKLHHQDLEKKAALSTVAAYSYR